MSDAPSIGVFLNDGASDKLGYYLANEVGVSAGNCRADGSREIEVKVTLRYPAPSDGLPSYVTGVSAPGAPYSLKTNVSIFAPVGGGLISATKGGAVKGIARGEEGAREVGSVGVELEPGQSTELVFKVSAPAPANGTVDVTPTLTLTPGVNPWKTSVGEFQSCSASGE